MKRTGKTSAVCALIGAIIISGVMLSACEARKGKRGDASAGTVHPLF